MKNIKALLLLFFLICAGLSTANGQITVVTDPASVPPNYAEFQENLNLVLPIQRQIALVPEADYLDVSKTSPYYHDGVDCAENRRVHFNLSIYGLGPTDPKDKADPFYVSLINHLWGHARPCVYYIANIAFAEGITEAVGKSISVAMRQQRPDAASKGWTNIPLANLMTYTNPYSWGTWQNYDQRINYGAAGGPLEIASNGDYTEFLRRVENTNTNKTPQENFRQYLQAADESFQDVNGRKPSDYLQSLPVFGHPAPDGQYLYLQVMWDEDFDRTVDPTGSPDLEFYSSVVNHRGRIFWYIQEVKDGITTIYQNGRLKWWLFDSEENIVLTGISDSNVDGSSNFYTDRPTEGIPGQPNTVVGAIFPKGNYGFGSCWLPPGTDVCPDNRNLAATNFIQVLRGIPEWWKNSTIVFANGGYSHDHRRLKGTPELHLVREPGDTTEETNLPGMLFLKHSHGSTRFNVRNSERTKTFKIAYSNPYYGYSLTQSLPWTEYNERLSAIANGADWKNNYAVRGGIYTAFGVFSKTLNWTSTLPLPTSLGNIEIVARVDNVDYPAPQFYNSEGQANFLLPNSIPQDATEAQISARIRGEDGNIILTSPIRVELRRNAPASFYANFEAKQPSAWFASGPKLYQLIGPGNPARTGDYVTQYATSLGPVTNTPEDGEAAKAKPLSELIDPIEVTIGGVSARVLWAGLAPGLVGLYQINYQVPQGVPAGLAKVVIKVNGVPSETEMYLAVAP